MFKPKNKIQIEYIQVAGKYDDRLDSVIKAFDDAYEDICSINNKNRKKSNEVLKELEKTIDFNEFNLEKGKKKSELLILDRPGSCYKFYPDGLSKDKTIAIEVEAGQAVCNYRFLKDFFEALTVPQIVYLVIAVRNEYWGGKRKTPAHDFETVKDFLISWFASKKVKVTNLNGILIVGY